ncbi:S1C family serine protease [Garciella nitratireducens]|uniref:Serine protease Do n=1 Tax=Garciella nitratireducens DSM 15102 TaxID=1121911 RepID=A0A1T4LUY5_9FIRM|nr:trypsin-like peptidase domain-containing protein [Garciella nitratireducens]SJZ58274.1 serine protease Do [Garciella nitratireducens DSM 15102]
MDEFNKKEDSQNRSDQDKGKKRFSFKQIVILVLIASFIGGTAIGAGYQLAGYIISGNLKGEMQQQSSLEENVNKNSSNKNTTPISQSNLTTQEIVKKVGPSVVSITSKVMTQDWFRNPSIQEGMGSGVIFQIDDKGVFILTNNHVIANSDELTVTFENNLQVKGEVVGVDEDSDLAVIKINKKNIPNALEGKIQVAEFGDSDKLTVGEKAIAIGNPLGYDDTVTVGVISALDRELQIADQNIKLIQTDAAINPGNSGGALVNNQGQVIGINTAKIADTEVEGIGFAIPINSAKPIIQELLKQGYVSRPYLGVMIKDIDEETSQIYKLPVGVLVVEVVENSAADKAGLQPGDVIIEIDGEKILSAEELTQKISNKKVGDKIHLIAVRNGDENKEFTITLKEKNAQE